MKVRCVRARSEDGAVAVEFGLIAPLLLLLVFGILDFGWFMNRDMLLDNASRDGVRIASLGGGYTATCDAVKAELSGSSIPAASACDGSGTPTQAKIRVDTLTSSGAAGNTTAQNSFDAAAISGTTVVVTVTYDYKWITPMMSGLFGGTKQLSSSTRMVVE